jgi:hypothetical protein
LTKTPGIQVEFNESSEELHRVIIYRTIQFWFCRSGTILDEIAVIPINVNFLAEHLSRVGGAALDDINGNEKEAHWIGGNHCRTV